MTGYYLAPGVTLKEESHGGGSLFINHPQRLIKLSAAGLTALRFLCGKKPGELNSQLSKFALNLESGGIILRQFPVSQEELLPFVSIVIPTYNRPQMLSLCLESLLKLDYPADKLEIMVVDDASSQPLSLNCLTKARSIRLIENQGQGAARNLAVREAKGEVIAFLDDDCQADAQWLRALAPCFQEADVAAVGGSVEPVVLNNALARYEQIQSPLFMGPLQRKVRKGSALSYLPTCNLLIRKETFLAAGGFDENLRVGEDVDLCWRLLESGANIYYLPAGRVYHAHRTRLIPFLQRRFNYGQSEAQLQRRHRGEKRRLILFPGHKYVALGTFSATIPALGRLGVDKGLSIGVAVLIISGMANLLLQQVRSHKRLKSGGYACQFSQVWKALKRSHNSALYIYCQNFSRYYSILALLISLPLSAPLVIAVLILHSWPAVAIYRLKQPPLSPVYFVIYHALENCFYQAGVLCGCWREYNWQPMALSFQNRE